MSTDDTPSDSAMPAPEKQPQLSAAEGSQLAIGLAELTKLGLPLAAGLKALATETAGGPLSSVLNALAERIEAGVPLEKAIEELDSTFPPHIKGVIKVGLRTGNLGETLSDFAEQQRQMRTLRRRIRHALLYPVLLILFSLPVLGFLLFVLLPQMRESLTYWDWFGDTNEYPPLTQFLFQIVDQGPKILLLLLVVSVVGLGVGILVGGTRFWDTLIRAVPLWGPTFAWSRVVNFSRTLETLLRHEVPLPEALRYTAEAVPGVGLRKESARLANAVERGGQFSAAVKQTGQFPPLLPAFIAWGERAGSVPEALDAAGQYAQHQVESHAERIRLVVPVMVFTGVAFIVGMLVLAIVIPLLKMIGGLMW